MIVEGHHDDNLRGELTLSCDEALRLADELRYAVEESRDHQSIHEIEFLVVSSNRRASLCVNPHIKSA